MYQNQYSGYYVQPPPNTEGYYPQYGGYYYPAPTQGNEYYQTTPPTTNNVQDQPNTENKSRSDQNEPPPPQAPPPPPPPPPPPGDDDMELESPTESDSKSLSQVESIAQPSQQTGNQWNMSSHQQGYQYQYDQSQQHDQNQYDPSQQPHQNQYDQTQKPGQNQYDQSQQSQNQYNQLQQQGQNQYDQVQRQGQDQYHQSSVEGQNQYDQSGQYQSQQLSQYRYDQSHQQPQGQYDQSYQQQQNQHNSSHQQTQNQYDQSYQQTQNQYDQSYQQTHNPYNQPYNPSYQSYAYYQPQVQYFTQNYIPPPGTGYQWGQPVGNWVPQWYPPDHGTHPPPLPLSSRGLNDYATPTTRGGEWPQWAGQKASNFGSRGRGLRGRGQGRTEISDRRSRWDIPSSTASNTGQYSSVPPPPELNKSTVTKTTPTPPPSTATTSPDTQPDTGKITTNQWPPGLQDYMVRAFEICATEEDKTRVEQYLKVEINEMFRDNRVWKIDWTKEPLPLEKFQRQAQKRKSRWDTPSPSSEFEPSPFPGPQENKVAPFGITIGNNKVGIMGAQPLGRGAGRGQKKVKRGKAKFFIDRTGGAGGGANLPALTEEDKIKVNQRSQRFMKGTEGNRKFKAKVLIEDLLKTVSVSGEDNDWNSFCVEGTCQDLEKRYLRLTSAPDPSTIRPEPILRQSLALVLDRCENGRDYNYICEQFKSIRQDLTIQGIRNDLTVDVYEEHGRIALKNGDWSEFNQCQSQLKVLYDEGLHGHKSEFMAYRILYHMMTNDTSDFIGVFKCITQDMLDDPAVFHALKLRRAWSFGNYNQFFRLYNTTPNYGRHLVNLFLERERKTALKTITKAYRPTLAVDYITFLLGFSSLEECQSFLIGCDAILDEQGLKVDCRLTYGKLTTS